MYGETWVFESIVGAIPGVDLDDRTALGVQFALFQGAAVVLAAAYGLWSALPAATAGILVATVGSALMLSIGRRVRAAPVPRSYRHLLFSSSLEVVLGVVGYAAVLTVLFVAQPRAGRSFLAAILGPSPPLVPTFFFLLVLWDLCYRIGTGWWTALLALYRSVALDVEPEASEAVRAIDGRTAVFGLVQLALLPFLRPYPLLLAKLVGHVLAVLVVLGTARARRFNSI
ncbi:MAG: hypothetical protein ABEJ76_06615 [Halanaeroarchaeum sp.]